MAARRLRVMHGAVRDFVTDKCERRWDLKKEHFEQVDPNGPALGKPLNQEDLIGTLHLFTVGVFESLDMLGVPYSVDDKAAWFHIWNVVGCHMGIGTEDALRKGGEPATIHPDCAFSLPLDPVASADTLALIRQRHWMASFEGSILVNALLADLARALPRGLKPYPAALMRYLLGDGTANMLGISHGGWLQQVLLTANSSRWVADAIRNRRRGAAVRFTTSELSAMATQRVLQSYLDDAEQGGPPFELSTSLRNAWGIGSRREPEPMTPSFAIGV
jgi:hypothetical protein